MSSARNAFLGICGLSIWAAGDGVALDQGGERPKRGSETLGSTGALAGLTRRLQSWPAEGFSIPKSSILGYGAGASAGEGCVK